LVRKVEIGSEKHCVLSNDYTMTMLIYVGLREDEVLVLGRMEDLCSGH